MENKTYRDNFESFLRESTDGFLMVPSRKVWYSIYNDMHPDRKWPSMAVCLLILSAVMFIGVSNNNSLSSAARRAAFASLADMPANEAVSSPDKNHHNGTATGITHPALTSSPVNNDDNLNTGNDINNTDIDNNLPGDHELFAENSGPAVSSASAPSANDNAITALASGRNMPFSAAIKISHSNGDAGNDELSTGGTNSAGSRRTTGTPGNKNAASNLAVNDPGAGADNNNTIILPGAIKENAQDKTIKLSAKTAAANDKPWVEDYAFRHKPQMNAFRDKAAISYYVTPSFGYRRYASNISDQLKDGYALNMEAGAAIKYKLTDRLKLKAGLQANYTNYTSSVTDLGHSTEAVPALGRGTAAVSSSSTYSVTPGSASLNNSTVQVSIPVGAEIKIAGRNKINWYAGATIQPSYVIGGNAFVLSADNKYYIADRSMLRRMNMNVAMETFVSFRPSPGIILSVGPQVRYQLLSTYKPSYQYTQKLYNAGIKIGLTTGF